MPCRVPVVSVLMPVFNAGPFLTLAIESLLAQTCGDLELIAVDDGSTDASAERLREWPRRDRRVRSFFQPENRGIPLTRNAALGHARGEYIAFLNHDDIALPSRLETQLRYLREHPHVGLLGTAIANIDAAGNPLNVTPMPESALEIRWLGLLDSPVRQSSAMLPRAAFERHGLRYDPAFVSNSDYEFLTRAARVVPAANLPEPLVQYRKHANNTSRTRWDLFVASGAQIAERNIRAELPSFPISLGEIADIRSTILGYTLRDAGRPLATLRRGVERYLDLFAAFAERHHGDPALTQLETSLVENGPAALALAPP